MAGFQNDATNVAPATGSPDPVPAGEYNVMISESDIVDTKAKTGKILKLTLQIVDGDFVGQNIYLNVNIRNPNPTAERIGAAELSAVQHAIGILRIEHDTQELHGFPFCVKVVVTPEEGQYAAKNEVKKIMPLGGGTQQQQPAQQPAPQQQQPVQGQQQPPMQQPVQGQQQPPMQQQQPPAQGQWQQPPQQQWGEQPQQQPPQQQQPAPQQQPPQQQQPAPQQQPPQQQQPAPQQQPVDTRPAWQRNQ